MQRGVILESKDEDAIKQKHLLEKDTLSAS
jgi:hypothetical protein